MSRFPPIPPSDQNPDQKAGHDEMDRVTLQCFGPKPAFTLKNSDGAFIGPFAQMLYTPYLGAPWVQLAQAVITTPLLSSRERELAALAVLYYTKCAYALYAHSKLGEAAGLSPSQVADARKGKLPEGLNERENEVYVFAGELSHLRGRLAAEVFERAKKVLGIDGTAAVMHTAGHFMYSSILLNAADVGLPEGEQS